MQEQTDPFFFPTASIFFFFFFYRGNVITIVVAKKEETGEKKDQPVSRCDGMCLFMSSSSVEVLVQRLWSLGLRQEIKGAAVAEWRYVVGSLVSAASIVGAVDVAVAGYEGCLFV
jgi:hypothetical protein